MKRQDTTKARPADRYLDDALRYLARCDRTASQIETHLLRTGATAAQARAVLAKLTALRYVDDEAYALRWAESRLRRVPMGKERLRAELLGKGLDEPVVERALAACYGGRDEESLGRAALSGRNKRTKTSARKAAGFLRQRGFEEEVIERVIRHARSERVEQE